MGKIVLLTDSTCDLSKELIEKYEIQVLPLYVTIGNESYKDGVEINALKMYEIADAKKIHPKTSTASFQDTYDFILKYLKQDYDVIYCGIGSDLSSQYNNVYLAKKEIEEQYIEYINKIHPVDSMNLSTGISLVLLKMYDAIKEGKTIDEVVNIGNTTALKVRAQFCVENLDYIHKGGRCSNSAKFFGTLLSIKPMLKVVNGKLSVTKKSIGSFKKALNIMMNEFKELFNNLDKEYIFITHSEGDKYAMYIKDVLKEELKEFTNVYETKAGCVISSHCGKYTTGILYIEK